MISIAPNVKESLQRYGIESRVPEMLSLAAIVTHPKGNRRYHNFVFDVQGNQLVAVTDLRGESFLVIEECQGCKGTGCTICAGTGEVKVIRRVK